MKQRKLLTRYFRYANSEVERRLNKEGKERIEEKLVCIGKIKKIGPLSQDEKRESTKDKAKRRSFNERLSVLWGRCFVKITIEKVEEEAVM